MARRTQQVDFPGMEQKTIRSIENRADKFDEKRALAAGLATERDNAEFKLMEAMFANVADLERETDALGKVTLAYRRGDYKVIVSGGQMHAKVKIKQASKPPASTSLNPPSSEASEETESEE